MTYQLVLQFSENEFPNFDKLIELETAVLGGLGNLGELDGHDIGSGEANIFILTGDPGAVFERIRDIKAVASHSNMRAAYRKLESEEYTILHPPGLAQFVVT